MCFFSEEVLDNSQVSAIQNSRKKCWGFGASAVLGFSGTLTLTWLFCFIWFGYFVCVFHP